MMFLLVGVDKGIHEIRAYEEAIVDGWPPDWPLCYSNCGLEFKKWLNL